jgi:chromosome partitioning protein
VAIIAVTGRKGGIGKSTLTANLAAELAALGHTVAVLDTDPQQSLVAWAGLGSGCLTTCVTAVETASPERFQAAVRTAAATAARVLIDTPPGFADPALLAALLADLVLLPAGPSPLDMLAAREALALTREARTQRGGLKPVIRFVPSKIQAHTTLSRDLVTSLAGFGEPVLPAIGQRVAVAEAALHGLTVREYAPSSAAHAEFIALAHAVEEVLSLCPAKPDSRTSPPGSPRPRPRRP